MAMLTLAQARTLLGWSQSELARRTKVNVTVVSGIERERHQPAHGLVLDIIDALRAGGLSGLRVEDVRFVKRSEARAS